MKSIDPGRHKAIKKIEEAILNGEEFDRKTGQKNALGKDDEMVELMPEDHFWLYLSNKLAPTVPSDGTLPVPSEAREVFEHGLGRTRILHPENQAFVLEHLEYYFAGRAEGLASEIKRPKDKKDENKSTKRRGLGRRNSPGTGAKRR